MPVVDIDNDSLVGSYYKGDDGQEEIRRLNEQHAVDVKNLGFLLHPSITRILSPDAHIAEIGTGTGIFLLDLAKMLPSTVQLTGFDISATAFPAVTSRPSNISFEILDAKASPPKYLHSQFDVIHCRYLNAAMPTREDWLAMAQTAYAMLKPGGWLQWVEKDVQQLANPLLGSPDSTTEGLRDLGTRMANLIPYVHDGIMDLPGVFEEVGLETQRLVYSSDCAASLREAFSRLHVRGLLFALRRKVAGDVEKMEKLERVGKRAWEDVESGGYFRLDMHVLIGRKPRL